METKAAAPVKDSLKDDPDLSHLTSKDYQHIYEPCEDSFLLMDSLKKDIEVLRSTLSPAPRVLEVGCGTGIISAYLARILGRGMFFATDKNPRAALAASKTFRRNGVRGDVILTDLVAGIDRRLQGAVDVLIFNPPYVPSPPEEMTGDGLSLAWAGGERGREVLDRLFPSIPGLLSPVCFFYLVVLAANDPAEICEIMGKFGFEGREVLSRKASNEKLSIWCFTRKPAKTEGEAKASTETKEDKAAASSKT